MPAKRLHSAANNLLARMERDLAAIRRALRKPLEEEIVKGGLTVPQTAVMQAIVNREGITLKDLSHAVSLAHSTVSGIVDRLEERGLLARRADPADGRVSRIYATPVVARFVRSTIPGLRRGPLGRALEKAAPAERMKIAWALQRLRALLEHTQDGA